MTKQTTVRVDSDTLERLFTFKTSPDDTYDDVIRRMMAESEHLKQGMSTSHSEC